MRHAILDSFRLVVGFLLVPPSASLIAVVTYDAMWHLGLLPAGAPIHSLDSATSLGFGIAILAAVMTLGGVVPGVLWLAKRGRLSVRSLVVLGAMLGNVPFAAIILGIVIVGLLRGEYLGDLSRYWYGSKGAVIRVMLGFITGVASALLFWVVAVAGADSRPTEAA